ncbi:GNAT family N-acetyltransferase [Pseudoalteromonas luteoviolacea]|uniref:GNAT family acetyltraansferase n=1 Tax=Pseudoalteromonas luteoviolacea S4054 TaxID=1129367 RepID=A0A0F6ADZ8_9GAMM|nr:GNAT family N-acetyltransferase [Pseudoalteromonas luteoviolacea]AOT08038.1 GNAT family acetyltransferase [Pseudoalteromonas luteoviolacea]AOT12955.1 GNAT family acetyltransferase [Pseudoalteromonas luteoviolacea]AOT17867.1 GNAT family acetyltransferase [Pseudoalteromonas luteoviolacea]KKE84410.1 GNAT family acetyltraansferase [Pseudoalteromonas luteoviolacea S4054]KZN71785.1 GNAT family acetyltraansferase [Pseudoalteromonas luteoviolacea S4047-1]
MIYHVDKVSWKQTQGQLRQIRERVFVCELHLPKQVEFDQHDKTADHVLIRDENDQAVGTGRLCSDGLISRIAIVKDHRNRQAYQSLIGYLADLAQQKGLEDVFVQCILDEVPTFLKSGFSKQGGVFMEAGIPRQRLKCPASMINSEPFTMLH